MKKLLYLIAFVPVVGFGAASRSMPGRAAANISMGNNFDVGSGKELTLSIWIKTTENATADFIIGKKNDVNVADIGYSIDQNTSDTVSSHMSDGGTQETCSSSQDSDGRWFYYTMRRNSIRSTLFENGTNLCTGLGIFVGVISSTNNFKIGNSDSTKIFAQGLAAHAMVSITSYTNDQIVESMYRPEVIFAGKSRSMYPLWYTQPGTEPDYGDAGTDGTVTGGNFYLPSTDGPPVIYGDIQ